MFTRKVRVFFNGKYHIVEVACEPYHSLERIEQAAINQLKRKAVLQKEKEKQRRERENQFIMNNLAYFWSEMKGNSRRFAK